MAFAIGPVSVSQITFDLKQLIEENFTSVEVEGELSNVKPSSAGHVYFTLKDDGAQLPCVMWRTVANRYKNYLDHGLKVVAKGDIQVYAPHGRYQMVVSQVRPAGLGALQQAFEALKLKLKDEGLFDEIHKKPIPTLATRIGVITAETGAAFQDIRDTIEERFPLATIILHPAAVQGDHAAPQLVKAIQHLDQQSDVDVIIIGRGGGSLEDLWPFNDEALARAIFECSTPVVSAVGHEVDFSISDFVADARASTPTKAAVMVTPDQNELRYALDDRANKLFRLINQRLERNTEKLGYLANHLKLERLHQKLDQKKEWLSMVEKNLANKILLLIAKKQENLIELKHRMELQNPNAPLEKGFTKITQDQQWIKKADALNTQRPFEIHFNDGGISIDQAKN